jgi:hypothetical protein
MTIKKNIKTKIRWIMSIYFLDNFMFRDDSSSQNIKNEQERSRSTKFSKVEDFINTFPIDSVISLIYRSYKEDGGQFYYDV